MYYIYCESMAGVVTGPYASREEVEDYIHYLEYQDDGGTVLVMTSQEAVRMMSYAPTPSMGSREYDTVPY